MLTNAAAENALLIVGIPMGPWRGGRRRRENVMGTQRVLSWLIVLIGVILIATPWLLSFAGDRVAQLDVVIGGVVVAILGIALVYAMQPHATQRLSH
jgi:SPW repeat